MTGGANHDPGGDGEGGFSLVEVIVAFAIVALGLAQFNQSTGSSYRAAVRTRIETIALSQVQSHLDSLAADGRLAAGETTGTYSDGTRWRLTAARLVAAKASDLLPAGDTPRPEGSGVDATPYWVVLEAMDRRGHTIVRLQTAKIVKAEP